MAPLLLLPQQPVVFELLMIEVFILEMCNINYINTRVQPRVHTYASMCARAHTHTSNKWSEKDL